MDPQGFVEFAIIQHLNGRSAMARAIFKSVARLALPLPGSHVGKGPTDRILDVRASSKTLESRQHSNVPPQPCRNAAHGNRHTELWSRNSPFVALGHGWP